MYQYILIVASKDQASTFGDLVVTFNLIKD